MERTQELFEKIDAYLNGTLKGKDLETFEANLQTNDVLRKEVEHYKLVQKALKDGDSIAFREKLKQIDKEIINEQSNNKQKKGITSRIYWTAAAVFIVLIGLTSLLYFQNTEKEDLFATYYAPYPINDLLRGQETANDTLLKLFASYYKEKEYQKVITILEDKVKPQSNDQLKLYLGNSHLNMDNYQAAVTIFNSIYKESQFYNDARWFLALTYIKKNDKTIALPILIELASYPNLYTSKAQKLKVALQ